MEPSRQPTSAEIKFSKKQLALAFAIAGISDAIGAFAAPLPPIVWVVDLGQRCASPHSCKGCQDPGRSARMDYRWGADDLDRYRKYAESLMWAAMRGSCCYGPI